MTLHPDRELVTDQSNNVTKVHLGGPTRLLGDSQECAGVGGYLQV